MNPIHTRSPTLDSRQLRAFAILVQTGSFTRAARELHLSQSAVSHAMKALESDVGCRLLNRMGKSVTMTQAGEQLLEHAHTILAEMEAARQRLTELGRWGHGRLRVGTSVTACQYILPAALRQFRQGFPQCAIHIEAGDTPRMLDLLAQHRVDVALALEPRIECGFEFQLMFEDELLFHVSPTHPWAEANKINREEIARQRFIFYTKTSYLYQMIEEYFLREELVLPTSVELGNIEAIKELVKLGLGISILAPWVASQELAAGSLVALQLGRAKLKRRWGILTRRGARLDLQQSTFIRLCREMAPRNTAPASSRLGEMAGG